MTRRWFAAKRYGYGWYPVTAEGWLVIVAYFLLVLGPLVAFAVLRPGAEPTPPAVALFIVYSLILTGLLIVICVKKGEKPRWRWGK